MREKDIALFNKTIHNIKKIITDIVKERKDYHKNLQKLGTEHDEEMKTLLGEAEEVLEELYELFEDLSNGEGK